MTGNGNVIVPTKLSIIICYYYITYILLLLCTLKPLHKLPLLVGNPWFPLHYGINKQSRSLDNPPPPSYIRFIISMIPLFFKRIGQVDIPIPLPFFCHEPHSRRIGPHFVDQPSTGAQHFFLLSPIFIIIIIVIIFFYESFWALIHNMIE